MSQTHLQWKQVDAPFTHASAIRIRSGPAPDAPLIVLCHGMGDTPEILLPLWPAVVSLPVHLVVPTGPYPFEVRGKDSIRIGGAWYLYDGGPERFQQTLNQSADWLREVLASVEQREGWVPSARALVGYSQGAYFGYVAALSHQDLFTRLVAVAGRLKTEFVSDALENPGSLQTLILHGADDASVSPDAAQQSHQTLIHAGYRAEKVVFPGDHRLTPLIDDKVSDWLTNAWNLDRQDS